MSWNERNWNELADRVLAGGVPTRQEALSVLTCPDEELPELLAAAYRVRRHHFGNRVQLYMLVNAKSGLCPEDCAYCSQSRVSTADIPRYPLLPVETLLEGARRAWELGAKTYCIVASGRGPTWHELEQVSAAVRAIKERFPLRVCCCLGLLDEEKAAFLQAAGVDRVNHNLNTSEAFYGEICHTHNFQDRLRTLEAVRAAGISLCSGCIVGMGETPADIVDLAFTLRRLDVASIPVNFLHPIEGTPLAGREALTPRYCLKVLCLFRFVCPDREIRMAGGRERNLRSLQAMGLYAANSLFLGDYLTTPGQAPEADRQMIADLGFEVETVTAGADDTAAGGAPPPPPSHTPTPPP
ncbi:MAG: biotin synthase BioB, partial [Clostridia bacterium]|nr:biotin synthase BioB [Clostridia bacterium]